MKKAAAAGSLLMQLPQVLVSPDRRCVKSVRGNLLRNALIALDGRRIGASYREMASAAFGHGRTASAWNSPSRAMKDQMIRALDKGSILVNDGYKRLLR
jgi:hypothetical protein